MTEASRGGFPMSHSSASSTGQRLGEGRRQRRYTDQPQASPRHSRNVNLEAMASGLAVVSADVDSASALIDHGRTRTARVARGINGCLCRRRRVADRPTRAPSSAGQGGGRAADRIDGTPSWRMSSVSMKGLARRDAALQYPALARQRARMKIR